MYCKTGLSHTRIDRIYKAMIARCYCKNSINYQRYGGRGIGVCDEWRANKKSFFDWAFSNGYTSELTLDRMDNEAGYSPTNCRWATYEEQANNCRSNRYLEAFGKRQTMAQWSKETGLAAGTIHARLKRGWSEERALSEALAKRGAVKHVEL